MSANSKIEWTDHTFNPWIGCTKVSPACDRCYAEVSTPSRTLGVTWGPHAERRRTSVGNWAMPKRWNAQAEAFQAQHGRRQRVFCASLADVFDNAVPQLWRTSLFGLIYDTPHLDWLLLTKRIGNAARMLKEDPPEGIDMAAVHNVWLGATIANQEEADRDIPKLLGVPAAKRFLSMEPLLGPVDLERPRPGPDLDQGGGRMICQPWLIQSGIDWVIVGGESGPNARPMHPNWARSLRDQCQAAGVPFFFKQWGNWRPAHWFDGPDADDDAGDDFVDVDRTPHQFVANDGRTWDTNGGRWMYPPMPLGHWCLMVDEGKKAAGRLLDGREWNEVPA